MASEHGEALSGRRGGVVVPTGFGGDDARAFAHALRIAHSMGTSMTNLHFGHVPDGDDDLSVRALLARWELAEAAGGDDGGFGFWVRKSGVPDDDMRDVVLRFADAHAMDLLVVATPRATFHFLSHDDKPTAAQVDTPTLFLPPDTRDVVDGASGSVHLATVLVPVAKAPPADGAVVVARELAAHLGIGVGRLVLLHVGEAGERPAVHVPAADGWESEWRAAEGSVADAVCEAAKACDADLIAMTTNGRRGFLEALLGSTVERVVDDAPCPVLAVPAGARPEA